MISSVCGLIPTFRIGRVGSLSTDTKESGLIGENRYVVPCEKGFRALTT
jgi:hypothetical protein